jgi:hypothetical protein
MERISCTHPGHGPARLTNPRPAGAALRGSIVGRGYALSLGAAPGFLALLPAPLYKGVTQRCR